MRVAFRADAALHIGLGHVMRCLTLAAALRDKGVITHFVCRQFNGDLAERIRSEGHLLHLLPAPADQPYSGPQADTRPPHAGWLGVDWETDVEETQSALAGYQFDWLIVDHYALDARWETWSRTYAKKIMVIDDLADRKHDCDVLLDQTFGRQTQDYTNLTPIHCQLLLGADYALLRPEFPLWREYSLNRRKEPQLKNILINLGGVDKDNVTGEVLDAIRHCRLPDNNRITVVMGATAPHLETVMQQAMTMPYPTEIKVNVSHMAKLMANSDLAIGAAGSTAWERCCLGLPTVSVVIADNQRLAAELLEQHQAIVSLDRSNINNLLCIILEPFENEPTKLLNLSQNARYITKGLGAALVSELITGKS